MVLTDYGGVVRRWGVVLFLVAFEFVVVELCFVMWFRMFGDGGLEQIVDDTIWRRKCHEVFCVVKRFHRIVLVFWQKMEIEA